MVIHKSIDYTLKNDDFENVLLKVVIFSATQSKDENDSFISLNY